MMNDNTISSNESIIKNFNQSDSNNQKDEKRLPLKNIVEALLFAENNPLTISRLSEITGATPEEIVSVINQLNNDYTIYNHSFRIEQVANGYQLYTLPEYSKWISMLYKTSYHRLSRPALETLAIIVYNQPITRPEIEKLRGVDCSGPLLTLLERKLIRIEGRAQKPGGPFLYGTGKEFLRYFGLTSLNDLPQKEELESFLKQQGSI
ncbi:MAG: SMC-Scp complex subunit ScpB [candidate division WOR-3 bacterium]